MFVACLKRCISNLIFLFVGRAALVGGGLCGGAPSLGLVALHTEPWKSNSNFDT